MNTEEIIRLAREAGLSHFYDSEGHCTGVTDARLCEEEKERNDDRLVEILSHFAALVAAHERNACAALCEEREAYSMPIPCPDGIPGCLVAHYVPGSREKTGRECAAAIRSRANG